MTPLPKAITIGEKYSPAMTIESQADADAYFERLVEHSMMFGHSREQAELVERQNLGYYAGYYDTATAERVQRLFSCVHPVFGKQTPTPEEALNAGTQFAQARGDARAGKRWYP